MRNMKTKKRYLKHVTIALAFVFLVAAALAFLEVWERQHAKYPHAETEANNTLTYEGREYVKNGSIETFLVLGLDKFNGASTSDSYMNDKQADFLMLFVFDNDKKQCSAIQINRDTMANVDVLGVSGERIDTVKKQIALAHTYGNGREVSCRNTKDSVEDLLLGITVNHYISFTMDSVPAMNDLVGGVELTVLDDFTGIDDSLVKGETVRLTGEQALCYVRTRYGLEDATNTNRMERQRQYIDALYRQTIDCINADDGFVIKLVDTMDDYVVYDSSDHKMQKLVEKFDSYDFMGITTLEGEIKYGEEFVEYYPDEDFIKKTVVSLFYVPKDGQS